MPLVPCGSNRTRVMSRSGHFETGPFCLFYLSPWFPAKNLAPGSLQSDDGQLGGPGASSVWSRFVMTTERMSSRAVDHRLDEPRQPSAWLRPRSARFCFTGRSHCSCRARPRKQPGHCRLPTKLPLPASLFQLTITRRMNLRLSSLQHILRRHIADCAVQTHRVVAIHVALNKRRASSNVSGVSGRMHSVFRDLCHRSNFPFD